MADTPAAAAPPANKGPLILALSNTLFVVAGLGMLAYTKILYHRPSITEEAERARIEALKASPAPEAMPGFVTFDPVTVNIAPVPGNPKSADGTDRQLQGKLHYANIGFALELRDISRKDDLESLRPLIMDRFLAMTGRKEFSDLVTVNGRYLLRTELVEAANQLIAKRTAPPAAPGSKDTAPGSNGEANRPDPWVTNIYFTQFLVQ